MFTFGKGTIIVEREITIKGFWVNLPLELQFYQPKEHRISSVDYNEVYVQKYFVDVFVKTHSRFPQLLKRAHHFLRSETKKDKYFTHRKLVTLTIVEQFFKYRHG